MNRRKSPIYKSPGFSPNIKPGLFSNHTELNKLNKQKTLKLDESSSPVLKETKESKESKVPPKLQKSFSATKLFSNNINNIKAAKQAPEEKEDKVNDTLQKLLKELTEFSENIEQSQTTNIEEWCSEILEKLHIIKENIEKKEDHSVSDIAMQQQFYSTYLGRDILAKLQRELQEEKKERYRIEEEATNLITEQEIEINRLEKELRLLEEKHQLQ